jgi:hypothetical protein
MKRVMRQPENALVVKNYHQRNVILKSLGYETYRDYLDSELWRSIRKAVFHRCRKCRLCGERANQAHHLDYDKDTLLGLRLDYIVPLCNGCHHKVEFDGKSKRSLEDSRRRYAELQGKVKKKELPSWQQKNRCSVCGHPAPKGTTLCRPCRRMAHSVSEPSGTVQALQVSGLLNRLKDRMESAR